MWYEERAANCGLAWPFTAQALYSANFLKVVQPLASTGWYVGVNTDEWNLAKPTLGQSKIARYSEALAFFPSRVPIIGGWWSITLATLFRRKAPLKRSRCSAGSISRTLRFFMKDTVQWRMNSSHCPTQNSLIYVWCPGRELNPQRLSTTDFKSAASASSATRACCCLRSGSCAVFWVWGGRLKALNCPGATR